VCAENGGYRQLIVCSETASDEDHGYGIRPAKHWPFRYNCSGTSNQHDIVSNAKLRHGSRNAATQPTPEELQSKRGGDDSTADPTLDRYTEIMTATALTSAVRGQRNTTLTCSAWRRKGQEIAMQLQKQSTTQRSPKHSAIIHTDTRVSCGEYKQAFWGEHVRNNDTLRRGYFSTTILSQ
jgi:hypothetical protein